MKHEIWLWAWFLIGMAMYWLKRAYYGVNPPNPIANNYLHWLQRSAVPLLVRAFIDSMFFWLLFTPGLTDKIISSFGWQDASWALDMVTQFPVFASCFGFMVDSVVDIAVTKIPFVKDVLPQMPGPLAPPA